MDEIAYFFSASLVDGSTLYLAELAEEEAVAAGYNPDDAVGYFLYRKRDDQAEVIEVLARIDDHDSAFEMSRLLSMH